MRVSRTVVVLLATAAIVFSGFVITDNVLSRRRHGGERQKENRDLHTNQVPLDSSHPHGQVGAFGGPNGPNGGRGETPPKKGSSTSPTEKNKHAPPQDKEQTHV